MTNANTQVTRAIFAALDTFENEIKSFGLRVERNLYSADVRGEGWMAADSMGEKPRRCMAYDVTMYSEELPVKGNAQLIERLELSGLHVVKRRHSQTGPLFFFVCKRATVFEEMGAAA